MTRVGTIRDRAVWALLPMLVSFAAASPAVSAAAAPQPIALIVKFKPDWHLPAAELYRQKRAFSAYTGSARLDALHQSYHVTDIRPLVSPPPAGRRVAMTTDQWAAHLDAIRDRFASRARRAAPGQRLPDLSTVYVLSVPEGTDVRQLAQAYGADPSVEYAEPNYTYRTAFTPNDPFFSSSGSWGQGFPDLWGLHNIQADQAWDLSTGAGATVAVIDTGLFVDHPEIRGNVWANPGEIASNGIDDDGNGFVDDIHGWDFILHTGALVDLFGHGTHVAGTIAAVGDNGGGIIGVAWQAHVMPLNVFDGLGNATADTIAAALMYAVENGADVVNMSLGGLDDSFLMRDAIDFAAANGLVLVAAAGNDAVDVKTFNPADLDAVIAVGAVDHRDQPASFSNFGGKIELAAPGGGDDGPPAFEPSNSVLSLGYGAFDQRLYLSAPVGNEIATLLRLAGTSMAAPHVSGTAALIVSRHPEFTAEQVRQALRDGADDLGPPGRDARYGYGRLNAARALARDSVLVARLTAPRHLSRFHGELTTIEGAVHDPGGPAPSWRVLFGPQGQTLNVIASGSGEMDPSVLASLDTAPLDRGNYVVRLEASAANGATGADTITFTRLATRPYLRQLSDQGGVPTLLPDAWSGDGRTLVWTDLVALGSYRVVATDLVTGTDRALVEFQFGNDNPLINGYVGIESVISSDGQTVAFSAPEDLSASNFSQANRNFQLFSLDVNSNTVQQLSHVLGAGRGSFQGLTITPDGGRIALTNVIDLDSAPGNPGFFYWDRADAAFHQITNPATPLTVHSPVLSADGLTIAFVSSADLDPGVGNPAHVFQVFVYDVPSAHTRQLTRMNSSSPPLRRLATEIALSPDGSKVAGSVDTLFASQPQNNQHSIILIDVASATATDLVSIPSAGQTASGVQFSRDGSHLYFAGPAVPDPLFPPFNPSASPPAGVFRYDLTNAKLDQLTGFAAFFSVGPDQRIACDAALADIGLDPEGANSDGTREVYLLDPETAGGFLWLHRGSIRRTAVTDRFKLDGYLVQPSGVPVDPSANGITVTLLGTNGQLFRAVVSPEALAATGDGWTFHDSRATGLTKLVVRKRDNAHYTFKAKGKGTGLFAAATPVIAVELQVGSAVFSNAHRFRGTAKQFLYP
jgi:subtilisin family serine protease/Tol biopolymer transport system component